jgi:outer membrane receptor protein involved in Fe transport
MAFKPYQWRFLFIFFLFPVFANGQATVSGLVTDSANGEALIGVVVTSSKGGGTQTDLSGNYSLKTSAGEQTLTFKYIGYSDYVVAVNVPSDQTVYVSATLVANSRQLKVVVISSGRYEQPIGEVPVSIEVVRPKLIENKNINSVETIMDQVPGVSMTDGQASIRGGSGFSYGAGSRVQLVVDDMPMLSGDANDVKWNYLPIENVSQVEVLKGASSALFGSSALNGVIHFRTAYPLSKPQTTISMHGGFYDEARRPELRWWTTTNPTFSGINFTHMRQIGNLDLVIGGHLFNDEGYRMLETEQRQRINVNTRYRFKKVPGLSAGINANIMHTSGGLFLLWQSDTLAYIPKDTTLQLYDNLRFNIDPFVTFYTPKGHRHALRTRFFRTDNRNDKNQGARADFYYGEYQYQHKTKKAFTITTGIVSSYTLVKSDLYLDHTASNLGVYAQADKKFFEKLFVTFGVRGEYYRVDTATSEFQFTLNQKDTTTLPFRPVIRAGINYQVATATYLRVSYGQGYRFPSIAEKFIRTDAGGLQIYPNTDLQPETGQSAEIGVKQGIAIGQWKGYADLAIFWMEYKNMVEFSFGQWGNPWVDPLFGLGFHSVNVGTTRTRGIDFSVMGEGDIGPVNVFLLAGYTYMDPVSLHFDPAKDTLVNSSTENILKYRYRHIAKFDTEAGYKKFSFGVSLRYNSFMENIDKIFELLPPDVLSGIKSYREKFNTGDVIFDARLLYRVNDNVRISIVENNIFNREYASRPADVQPPRNFAFQLMVKF